MISVSGWSLKRKIVTSSVFSFVVVVVVLVNTDWKLHLYNSYVFCDSEVNLTLSNSR